MSMKERRGVGKTAGFGSEKNRKSLKRHNIILAGRFFTPLLSERPNLPSCRAGYQNLITRVAVLDDIALRSPAFGVELSEKIWTEPVELACVS